MTDLPPDVSGRRRPLTEEIPDVLQAVSEGSSLAAACKARGLDTPSTHKFIDDDAAHRQSYARAKELRAEVQQEQALAVAMAAATGRKLDGQVIKPDGARVLLDAIKWTTARMSPKTAPVGRHEISGKDGGPIPMNFGNLTSGQLDKLIARIDQDVEIAGGEGGGSEGT